MKFYLSFLFTIIIHQITLGQEKEGNVSTIIFSDDTTMEGIGEIKRNKIYFKITEEDKYTEWDYTSAKGIIFTGYGFSEKYEYAKPDKNSKPVIMEVVDDGFVKLYRKNKMVLTFINQPHSPNPNNSLPQNFNLGEDLSTTYYVKKKNEDFATNITNGFKAKSIKYFSDCKSLVEKIYDRTFTADKIKAMVDYYNNYCDGNEN